MIILTPEGAAAEALSGAADKIERDFLDALDPGDQAELNRLLRLLLDSHKT
ncbi:hypothetical protein [Spongiactinospora sp. TRM90649]|uniref:hypothetical protein n=1 Tax=Spongiactinospora sp. TRM90649 TaxID=3031114 RepID=UPI0023F96C34|nr:hypothetical protein [Spongiactinospora sp. TRM90649]MDF5754846.1 hypothetical protein [Spongiactinospora sp. TRM90649]